MNFISIEALEKNFLNCEYDLFLRRLKNKSLINDFSILFDGKLALDSACKVFFSDRNIHAVESFCHLFKTKMKKEFKYNSDKVLVAKTISDIIQCLVSDISNLSNKGGAFIAYKSVASVKEITKLCIDFKKYCVQYNLNNYVDQPPLWFYRFSQEGWEEGAKAVLSVYENFWDYENQNKQYYTKEFFNNYNAYLCWKDELGFIEQSEEIINKLKKTEFGFGKGCSVELILLESNSSDVLIKELWEKGVSLHKIGNLRFWINNTELLKELIQEIKYDEILSFKENVLEASQQDDYINQDELKKLIKICENTLLLNELSMSLPNESKKENKKLKV